MIDEKDIYYIELLRAKMYNENCTSFDDEEVCRIMGATVSPNRNIKAFIKYRDLGFLRYNENDTKRKS